MPRLTLPVPSFWQARFWLPSLRPTGRGWGRGPAVMRIVGVSELTSYLKSLLEEDYYLQDTWVRGEITNYVQSGAGHRYFSVKDERASLRCVLFRGNGSSAPSLRNGMAVFVHGRLSVYEARGDVQFYVDAVEDAG